MKINIPEILKQIEEVEEEIEEDLLLTNAVRNDVYDELKRQRKMYHVQRHPNNEWLPILIEEVGEVAEALQIDTQAAKESDADDLYTELTQVAAVAISWAAQLREKK